MNTLFKKTFWSLSLLLAVSFSTVFAQGDLSSRVRDLEDQMAGIEDGCCPSTNPCDLHTLKIHGYAQVDTRLFFETHPAVSQFLIRRARLYFDGTIDKDWNYCLYGDFARSFSLIYAWLEYAKFDCARLKFGQFKQPFSLEYLTSSSRIPFIERSMVVDALAAKEDIGLQLHGNVWCDRIYYAIGVFNGAGKNIDDTDSDKDIVARIIYQPFLCSDCCWMKGLYLSGGYANGRRNDEDMSKTFKTAGRVTFVNWSGASQDGNHERFDANFEWFCGPAWVGGEFIHERRSGVTSGANRHDIDSWGWYIAGRYVLTGETIERNNSVIPCYNFDPCECSWGAWEVNARYEWFEVDTAPFTAATLSGTDRAWAVTSGVTWWINRRVKIMANGVHTDFKQNITAAGKSISHEDVLLFRAQYIF